MDELSEPSSLVGDDGVLRINNPQLAKTVSVFGPSDLTNEEFAAHYALRLYLAHQAGATFVVGDDHGCDTMAQAFLKKLGATVVVYYTREAPRNNAGFEARGVFLDDSERDQAMAAASAKEVTWVRPSGV